MCCGAHLRRSAQILLNLLLPSLGWSRLKQQKAGWNRVDCWQNILPVLPPSLQPSFCCFCLAREAVSFGQNSFGFLRIFPRLLEARIFGRNSLILAEISNNHFSAKIDMFQLPKQGHFPQFVCIYPPWCRNHEGHGRCGPWHFLQVSRNFLITLMPNFCQWG